MLTAPKGWRFWTADFSRINRHGQVMFVRIPEERDKWYDLPNEHQNKIALYAYGDGMTIEEAFADASLDAEHYGATIEEALEMVLLYENLG